LETAHLKALRVRTEAYHDTHHQQHQIPHKTGSVSQNLNFSLVCHNRMQSFSLTGLIIFREAVFIGFFEIFAIGGAT
jgi:hypothetical protein